MSADYNLSAAVVAAALCRQQEAERMCREEEELQKGSFFERIALKILFKATG